MPSLNRVELIGRVGRDPEVRTMQNGSKVVTISVATSDGWKDKTTGEWKERTEWHKIVLFNEHFCKMAENSLYKGAMVRVVGALQTRKWQDQSGNDRYSTEVVLQKFSGELMLLSERKDNEAPRNDGESYGGGFDNHQAPLDRGIDSEIPF